MDFTIQEINTLIEALKAWQQEPGDTAFSTTLLGAVMVSGREGAEAFRADAARDLERAKYEQRQREETAVLIQAKLIRARRELEAAASDEFGSAVNERARAVLLDREPPE